MSSEKETNKEVWWKDHTAEEVTKRAGRRVDPNAVSINKTTVAFGRKFVSVFEGAKSVIIKTLKNYQGEIDGLIFDPRKREEAGYTIRAPADRQTIQLTLPKPIRPAFDKLNLYGTYKGKIHKSAPGYEDHQIITVRFGKRVT